MLRTQAKGQGSAMTVIPTLDLHGMFSQIMGCLNTLENAAKQQSKPFTHILVASQEHEFTQGPGYPRHDILPQQNRGKQIDSNERHPSGEKSSCTIAKTIDFSSRSTITGGLL